MPPTWRLFVAAILLAVGSGAPAYARDPAPNARAVSDAVDPTLPAVQAATRQLIDNRQIAGAVVLVAHDGEIVHFNAQGMQDIEHQVPMQTDTLFRIYSMTKPVTSVAVLVLMEQGLLALDDSIAQHLPEFANLEVYRSGGRRTRLKTAVTIRDLLRHTSGMTYGFFSDGPVDKLYMEDHPLFSPDQNTMIQKMARLPLVEQPGKTWLYGMSTDVLGALVERVSGRSLGQFFREEIFSPLGMNDTFFHVPDSKMKRFASSYGPELELVESAEESPYRQPERHQSGGGGLVSTAEDYLRFCTMLLNNGALGERRILQPETVASMTQNHLPNGVYAHGIDGFGLGVKVRLQDRGHQAHQGQYGWNGVASTHFFVSPKDKIVFIALSQRQPFSDQLRRTLTPLVYQALAD